MAGDFNKPVVTDAYASVLQSIKDLISDLAKGLDGTSTANIPTNAIRWSSTNNRFEKYNGSTWVALASTFAMNVTSVNGYAPGNTSGSLAINNGTVNTNLNADTVDGVHASGLAYRAFLGGTDMNTYQTPGVYEYDPVVNGAPTSEPNHRVLWMGNSARVTNLAFPYSTDRLFFRRGNDGTWSSWKEIWHTGNFTPNATAQNNIGAAGTYGGMNITGANNGWAGFQFNSTSRYFMSSGGQTGEYDSSAGAWQWRWDNGTLSYGTVPWARLSGVPAMSFLALTGGGLTGLVSTAGNTQPFNSANDQTISVRSSGTGTAAVMSFHRPGAYAINMGLDTDNIFKIGGWSAGAPVFQLNMSGQLWTSNYGWLHDYFTRTVNAGYYLTGGGSGSNLTISHAPGFSGSGAPGSITISGGHITAASFNCNCNCSNG